MKIYDPLYGKIDINPLFAPIVNSIWFRRLQNLRQLGLCYLSFPGGNHTRYEHSLGTFHLACIVSKELSELDIFSNSRERERLSLLIQLGALFHDIGHGPFSHMTENALLGLGWTVTHEEVGAAIVSHFLNQEFCNFKKWEITPSVIGEIITKSVSTDSDARCVIELISSDFDLDRLDYLHRDMLYSGIEMKLINPANELNGIWSLKRLNNALFLELSENGLRYVEKILFIRRNNYQQIVFESRHMAATGMFEKAINIAAKSNSDLSKKILNISKIKLDWSDPKSVKKNFFKIWGIYGLVDYDALNLLESITQDTRYLMQRIRRGQFYESVCRITWHDLHYLSKQTIVQYKDEKNIFSFRRDIEEYLAKLCKTKSIHIVVNIPRFNLPNPLLLGISTGSTFGESSSLGQFFYDDYLRQYAIEIFVDQVVEKTIKENISKTCAVIFKKGEFLNYFKAHT